MAKSGLLPCPFCAGKAEILDCSTKTLETITIACECGASMSGYAILENDIIAAWDTRIKTKAELNAELLAALVTALDFLDHKDILDEFAGKQAHNFVSKARAVIAKAKELAE